jgi:hypothetical protein
MTKKEKIKQRRINGKSHGIVMRHMQRQKGKTETHVTSEAIWAVLFFVLLMLPSGTDPGWGCRARNGYALAKDDIAGQQAMIVHPAVHKRLQGNSCFHPTETGTGIFDSRMPDFCGCRWKGTGWGKFGRHEKKRKRLAYTLS